MRIYIYFLIFLYCLFGINSKFVAQIKEIDSLLQIEKNLSEIDVASTLVVFDIHGVLIMPEEIMHNLAWQNSDYFEHSDFVKELQKTLQQECVKNADLTYIDKLLTIVWQKSHIVPIEPTTVNFVQNLLKKGCKILGMTRCDVSPWGKFMPNIREWNYLKLCENGIDLNQNFNFRGIDLGTTFYKGILFAGDGAKNKGVILGEFLDAISGIWKPSKIICFDDKNNDLYLESFELEMKKRGMDCICFWYKAMSNKLINFDPDILKIQYDYLLKYKNYIDEASAKTMMIDNFINSKK